MFAEPARAAWAFDGGGRQSTLRATRRFYRRQLRPACWTRRPPTPLENLGTAKNTRDRKKEIQNCVDHRASRGRRKGRDQSSVGAFGQSRDFAKISAASIGKGRCLSLKPSRAAA